MFRLVLAALALFFVPLAAEASSRARQIRVVDGDTLEIRTKTPYKVRIEGMDAPERIGAKCPEEKALAARAKARMQEMVDSGNIRIARSTRKDKWGRVLTRVYLKDTDVARIMIRERLARPYSDAVRQSWC